ncbi:MAG: endoglucanase [archaeon]|nr:endoglucanase [archaeon]
MDKSNIIISIIIVVCIAAAVAAYGLTSNNNNIFTDLANMGSDDSSSHGGILANSASSHGTNTARSGSGSSSGGGSSGGGGSGGGECGGFEISQAQAQTIAQNHIHVDGCTAVYSSEDSENYYFVVVDSNDKVVDGINVNKQTGKTGKT